MIKDLHNGKLFWPTTLPSTSTYPALQQNVRTKVAIIGGGMSGCIVGYTLAKNGFEVVLLERSHVAGGSTSANTGLLQFSNDIMLSDLMKQIGDKPAVRFYEACRQAVLDLKQTASEVGANVDYFDRSSLYYASTEQDLIKLKREYEALRANGFDVEYWEPAQIAARFPFRKSGAIVTHGDGEFNPFKFVHAVADTAVRHGMTICEQTDIVSHDTTAQGLQRLTTASGAVVEAEHVVYSVGYEPEQLKGQLIKQTMNRSFAMVTEPVAGRDPWHQKWLLWETARPYLYIRTTADNRIVAGGLDQESIVPYNSPAQIVKYVGKLYEQVQALVGDLLPPAEYQWNALFAGSRDNLPFLGEDPARPGVYYVLGYGGNGDVYCMLGAKLILSKLSGEVHPAEDIVRLDRRTLQMV
ncbi:glycine/D-amino acid oxidase-like deaminating enzyme [Paenibacillus phyllosphaerae]|uniref:Glycine/D-amino acid oxidase-like deaminating enzyme n=1 Tax=Paenibacillus phyllosphaerae TaxID=274593 RepID=A0A7W5ATS7_9BACL|nr:FAD-dependent oxidoreductase [Paenibacillus phyllosphaerae]MBB3108533.1 glycine/D-amino acid oxidase-like deaminating enzyme [Paenibacillus phyllosphaerae]